MMTPMICGYFQKPYMKLIKVIAALLLLTGKEALQLLQNAIVKPHYIFMDLNLPVMNGKECLREIKKKPRFADTPVIIYSTSKLKTDMEEVYKLGATHFLTKPNSFHGIVKIISDVLKGKLEEIDH